jgi:hypothetical protein
MLALRFHGPDIDEISYSYGDFRGARFKAGGVLILYFDTATIT